MRSCIICIIRSIFLGDQVKYGKGKHIALVCDIKHVALVCDVRHVALVCDIRHVALVCDVRDVALVCDIRNSYKISVGKK